MQDMLVRLYAMPSHKGRLDELRKEGVILRHAISPERHIVIDWVRQHFGQGWANECEDSFGRHPVQCWIATEGGKLLGFACYDVTARGFFGPTGVLPAHRGRGIGKVLLWKSLRSLKEMGYAYAIIGGVGPKEFYERTIGATLIEGSDPGIYRNMLRDKS